MTNDDERDWLDELTAMFTTGRQLAEQLFDQNLRLREQVVQLEAQLASRNPPEAGAAEESPGAGEALGKRLEDLQAHHQALLQEYTDLERQNSNYLSLYVASSQIHATLVFEEVLGNIKEILINLVGADVFAIYLYDESGRQFRRTASEGELDPADEFVPYGDNLLSEVVRSGSLCLQTRDADFPSGQQPIAILPLTIGPQPIGVVVLFRLLVQKEDFDTFDMELFDLLAAHAATALMSSSKYQRLERKVRTLQGLLDLFKVGDPNELG